MGIKVAGSLIKHVNKVIGSWFEITLVDVMNKLG